MSSLPALSSHSKCSTGHYRMLLKSCFITFYHSKATWLTKLMYLRMNIDPCHSKLQWTARIFEALCAFHWNDLRLCKMNYVVPKIPICSVLIPYNWNWNIIAKYFEREEFFLHTTPDVMCVLFKRWRPIWLCHYCLNSWGTAHSSTKIRLPLGLVATVMWLRGSTATSLSSASAGGLYSNLTCKGI